MVPARNPILVTWAAMVTVVLAVVLLVPVPGPDTTLERAMRLHSAAGMLNAQLLTSASATATLTTWCKDHDLADPPTVTATRDPDASNPVTAAQREQLGVGTDEPIEYRYVELRCGTRLLSKAENWYVPRRLTEPMQRQLKDPKDTTPFGTVVKPLGISRQTTKTTALNLLPEGWERLPLDEVRQYVHEHPDLIRHVEDRPLFSHEAIVTGKLTPADAQPIALVRETYQMGTLYFLAQRP